MNAKTRALQAIREVVGPETLVVKKRGTPNSPQSQESVQLATANRQLRRLLLALLVLHTDNPERCPNCDSALPRHVAGCRLERLLRRTRG